MMGGNDVDFHTTFACDRANRYSVLSWRLYLLDINQAYERVRGKSTIIPSPYGDMSIRKAARVRCLGDPRGWRRLRSG